MNKTAIYSADHSWSRRCSTETILSMQGQETDYVRDTTDTESATDGEYEPVTEAEDEAFVGTDTSAGTDNDIIATKVIEVSVGDEGDLVFADSERTDDAQSDSDVDLFDYWNCAQCASVNDNPIYRYCGKCFQVRKSLFPPRPRRKHKRTRNSRIRIEPDLPSPHGPPSLDPPSPQEPSDPFSQEDPRPCSQDSGIGSQGTSQELNVRKRHADSIHLTPKRAKYSDDEDVKISPISKSLSDPSITIENVKVTKKVIADTLKEIDTKDLCVVCVSEPKSGVFVHGRLAHICCCYKCAVKVWAKTKRCPICNSKISNVLKAVIM